MTDKELNTAILNDLYKIADEVWASMEKGVIGSFTAHEVVKHIEKDIFWGKNDANKLRQVEVGNYRCSFPIDQTFDLVRKFESLVGLNRKPHLFVAESEGEVEGSVIFAITKDLKELCKFADSRKLFYPYIIIDTERKCLIATNGETMKVCPVTIYKKIGDTSDMRISVANFKKLCDKMNGKNVYLMTAKKERSGDDVYTNIEFAGVVACTQHFFALPNVFSVFSARSSELCFDVQDWKALQKLAKIKNGEECLTIRGKRNDRYVMFKTGNCKFSVSIGKALKHSFCLFFEKKQFANCQQAESMRLYLGTKDSDLVEAVDNNGNAYVFSPTIDKKKNFVGEHLGDILVAPEVPFDIDVLERYVLKEKHSVKEAPGNASTTEKAVAKKKINQQGKKEIDNSRKFTLAAIGVKYGDKLTFIDGKEVVAVDDNKVSFEGNTHTLSGFCKTYMPEEKRNKSNSYRGCVFFYKEGVKLEKLFNEVLKAEEQPTEVALIAQNPQAKEHAETEEEEQNVKACSRTHTTILPCSVSTETLLMLQPENSILLPLGRCGMARSINMRNKRLPTTSSGLWMEKDLHAFSLPPPSSLF